MREFTVGVGADLYTHYPDGTTRRFHRGDEYGPWRSGFIWLAHRRFRNDPPGLRVPKLCDVFRANHDGLEPWPGAPAHAR